MEVEGRRAGGEFFSRPSVVVVKVKRKIQMTEVKRES